MRLNQAKDDLEKLEIEAIKIEKAEDAVAAASAELIESLTVGVAEAAGAEAGEEAGSLAAADAAQVWPLRQLFCFPFVKNHGCA